jgi:hypothetical protein
MCCLLALLLVLRTSLGLFFIIFGLSSAKWNYYARILVAVRLTETSSNESFLSWLPLLFKAFLIHWSFIIFGVTVVNLISPLF